MAYSIALIYLKTQKECADIFSFQSEGYICNIVKSPQLLPHRTSRVWPLQLTHETGTFTLRGQSASLSLNASTFGLNSCADELPTHTQPPL